MNALVTELVEALPRRKLSLAGYRFKLEALEQSAAAFRNKEVGCYIQQGALLIHARADHPGEFVAWCERELPFSVDKAQLLMRIARNPEFVKTEYVRHLPRTLTALVELDKASPERLAEGIATGEVNPDMPREAAREFAAPSAPPAPMQRPSRHIEPRTQDNLYAPIFSWDDLLSALKGFRHELVKLSQLAMDAKAGFADGHAGKLEIDTRRPGPYIFDTLLDAYEMALIPVPRANAIRNDRCPCCGSAQNSPASAT